jgi:hypothetical protein
MPLLDDPNYWADEKLPSKSRMSTIVLDVAGALLWAGIMVWCLVMFSVGGWIGRGGAGLVVALNVGLYFQVVNLRRKLNP